MESCSDVLSLSDPMMLAHADGFFDKNHKPPARSLILRRYAEYVARNCHKPSKIMLCDIVFNSGMAWWERGARVMRSEGLALQRRICWT